MRIFLYTILLSVLCVNLYGQEKQSIIADLNATKAGQGRVIVMQDESIDKLMGIYHARGSSQTDFSNSDDYIKVRGWKIQIFTGNGQKAKTEAERRRELVRSAFPDMEAALTYTAPIWRLRVGNFLNQEEAEEKLVEIKEVLPSVAKEMYVVQDVVKKAF